MEDKILRNGTTTVGIKTKDAIILAADRKATMGNLVADKDVQKVFKIWDHIGVTTAGSVGDLNMLVRFLQSKLRTHFLEYEEEMDTEALATYLSTILNSNRMFPYLVQIIIGGTVHTPQLFSIDAIGGMTEIKTYTATGSGSTMAYGVLEDRYNTDISTEEGIQLAIRAVNAGRERDVYSGGTGVDVAVITKDGYHQLTKEEVKKYTK